MANSAPVRSLLLILIAIAIGYALYGLLNKPDDRNVLQRAGDAVEKLPEGGDKAARELKDRTPAQRLGDSVKDEADKLDNTTTGNHQ